LNRFQCDIVSTTPLPLLLCVAANTVNQKFLEFILARSLHTHAHTHLWGGGVNNEHVNHYLQFHFALKRRLT
jgi:hypothetical protein